MKKLIITSMALIALTACTDKVAFVDNAKLIEGYQEKIDVKAKLDSKVSAYEKKRDSTLQALQAEALSFNQQAKSIPQPILKKIADSLLAKKDVLLQNLAQEEQALKTESQQKLDSLISKMKKNISEYGKQKGYTFILGANDSGNVLYGSESKDITNEVLEYLNQQYKNK